MDDAAVDVIAVGTRKKSIEVEVVNAFTVLIKNFYSGNESYSLEDKIKIKQLELELAVLRTATRKLSADLAAKNFEKIYTGY